MATSNSIGGADPFFKNLQLKSFEMFNGVVLAEMPLGPSETDITSHFLFLPFSLQDSGQKLTYAQIIQKKKEAAEALERERAAAAAAGQTLETKGKTRRQSNFNCYSEFFQETRMRKWKRQWKQSQGWQRREPLKAKLTRVASMPL